MTIPTGIDKIAFYIPPYSLDLAELAARDGIDTEKFYNGIGQKRFTMPAHDEDIVTMGANAAALILDDADR